MRKMTVGLLAAACITLAVPAHAQGVRFDAGPGGSHAYAPGYGYTPADRSHPYDRGPGYNDYGYAYAPRGRANYRSWSRGLNHGQGPGCIQSPASLEYTSCD